MNHRKTSQKQEKSIARALGGRVQSGSGSIWKNKGDVRSNRFLVEAKTTTKQQYTLKKETLDKIKKEAFFERREWAMVVDIAGERFAVVDARYLEELEENCP